MSLPHSTITTERQSLTLSNDSEDPLNYHYKRYYYDNGQIKLKVRYRGNKRHGPEVGYHRNGVIMCEFHWDNDKLNGAFRFYHDNGSIDICGYLVDNVLNGIAEMYYSDGSPRVKGYFAEGRKITTWHYWDINGQKTSIKYKYRTNV